MNDEQGKQPERTALYRFFDAEKSLLYVGIAADPDKRQKQHARDAGETWYPLAAERTVAWFGSRSDAESAERKAIATERPRYNSKHSVHFGPESLQMTLQRLDRANRLLAGSHAPGYTPTTYRYFALVERIRKQIENGTLAGGVKLPSISEYRSSFGLSDQTVRRALSILVDEGLITRRPGRGYFVASPDTSLRPSVEARTVRVPVDHPERAASALRAAMNDEQLAALIAALSEYRGTGSSWQYGA